MVRWLSQPITSRETGLSIPPVPPWRIRVAPRYPGRGDHDRALGAEDAHGALLPHADPGGQLREDAAGELERGDGVLVDAALRADLAGAVDLLRLGEGLARRHAGDQAGHG